MGPGGLFDPEVPITTLMQTCTKAAFSEDLYIWHKAFNGWSRFQYMDPPTISELSQWLL